MALFEAELVAAELVREHPPRFQHPNKEVAYRAACPPGAIHAGTLRYTRHAAAQPPVAVATGRRTAIERRPGFFSYEPPAASEVHWHLNFANADLFCMYGARVLAQDELQIVEHPALASLREALLASKEHLRTVVDGVPTPITVMGVERRCRFSAEQLYGRRFATASPEQVVQAITPLVPPSVSNILAIEAPAGGSGRYTRRQIDFVLRTAYAGFRAARLESARHREGPQPLTVVHTGYWGCGAYGGNRVLMALLQLLAAHLAGLDRLVFHVGDDAAPFERATAILSSLLPRGRLRQLVGLSAPEIALATVLDRLAAMGFEWGRSDGT